ncbi:hypothetical protein RF11_12969 [Thelohanellus kitauei]|uniref:Uncharacterized protein n=1 Tax=Thelohanellus kitauei TaxID=669202 RepID=A0A0C2IRY0_THEKT|nr:hypothetical protein RF11_12969 [Thelohanellus kitauei]
MRPSINNALSNARPRPRVNINMHSIWLPTILTFPSILGMVPEWLATVKPGLAIAWDLKRYPNSPAGVHVLHSSPHKPKFPLLLDNICHVALCFLLIQGCTDD